MVTELRVHGVGGATPEDLLEDAYPPQVGGDRVAGFYRRRTDAACEAYSWGGLTSRRASRALWLVMLPFALCNLAGWTTKDGGEHARWRIGAVRFVGILATMLYVLWIQSFFFALARAPLPHDFFDGWKPGSRMAVAACAGFGVAVLLRWLGRQTSKDYEAFHLDMTRGEDTGSDPAGREGLTAHTFWSHQNLVERLAELHFTGAVCAIGASLAYELAFLEPALWLPWNIISAVFGAGALTAGAVAGFGAWGKRCRAFASTIGWIFASLAAAILLFAMITALLDAEPPVPAVNGPSPHAVIARAVYAVACTTVLALALDGLITCGIVVMGLGLLGGTMAGIAIAVHWVWNVTYPPIYDGFAVAFVASLLVSAVCAGWVYSNARGPKVDGETRFSRSVRMFRGIHGVVAGARTIIAWMTVTAIATTTAVFVFWSDDWTRGWARLATGLCAFVLLGLAAGSGALLVQAYLNPRLRRVTGVIWDVATFWPRWYHPWAPPSYSERAVPEMAERLLALDGQGGVLICAHSQGTVISAAAMLQLMDEQGKPRLKASGLLTFGSPLVSLYQRFFPAFFGDATLKAVQTATSGRWRNLWRDTDPISAEVPGLGEQQVPEPDAWDDPEEGQPLGATRGHRQDARSHGGYRRSPEFAKARTELLAEIATAIAAGSGQRP